MFFLCRKTRGLSFLSMTCFWGELALVCLLTGLFQVTSWGTLESERTQEKAAVENITKIYKYLWGSSRNIRVEHYSTCMQRKTNNYLNLSPGNWQILPSSPMYGRLKYCYHSLLYVPALRDLHSCHRVLPKDCGEVHYYLHQFSILSFNANPPLPCDDDKGISNSAVSEAE